MQIWFPLDTLCQEETASKITFRQPSDTETQQSPAKCINHNNMKNVSTLVHCGATSVLPIHKHYSTDELYKTLKAVARMEISASAEKSS